MVKPTQPDLAGNQVIRETLNPAVNINSPFDNDGNRPFRPADGNADKDVVDPPKPWDYNLPNVPNDEDGSGNPVDPVDPVDQPDVTPPDFSALIDELNGKIADAYASLFGSSQDKWEEMIENGNHITGILSLWHQLGKELFGLNNANALQYAQSIYNTLFALVDKQLTYDYNLKNWYMQQDYNSPACAIQRLKEAGINPAYYFGCMGQANADAIGQTQQTQAPTTQYGDNTTDAQRRLNAIGGFLGNAAGAVGSLVSGGFGGATAAIKNLADATGVLGNLELQQNITPYQISQLMGQTAANYANANLQNKTAEFTPDVMKAQQYELTEHAKNYRDTIETKQREIDSMLQIARWNVDSQNYNAEQDRLAQVICANIGKFATMYAADKSNEGTQYSARMGLAQSILPHVYTKQRQHTLYSKKTGEKLNLTAKQQADLTWKILKGEINFQEGKEFTYEGQEVVGYDFDTDVLDVMRLGGMNDYYNNFIETGHVFGGNETQTIQQKASAFGDFMDMVSHAYRYIKKAAAGKIAGALMEDAKNQDALDNPGFPMFNPQQQSFDFTTGKQ